MESSDIKIIPVFSLSAIGAILGAVFSVLQASGVINIGWFWATFPFWIVPALGVVFWIIAFIASIILVTVIAHKEK